MSKSLLGMPGGGSRYSVSFLQCLVLLTFSPKKHTCHSTMGRERAGTLSPFPVSLLFIDAGPFDIGSSEIH